MASSKPGGAPSNGEPALSFEAALERLRSIVESLERGELTLDDSIAHYEEGMRLSQRLTQQLDEAERRIERLIESADESEPPTTQSADLELRGGEPSEGELPF